MNINLNISGLYDDISIVPYEPSTEDLVDIIQQLQSKTNIHELTDIFNQIEDTVDKLHNCIVIEKHIEQYGVTDELVSLVGQESLLSNIGSAIVSFFKWLWTLIKKLYNAIKSVFNFSKTNTVTADDVVKQPKLVAQAASENKDLNKQVVEKLKSLDRSAKEYIDLEYDVYNLGAVCGRFAGIAESIFTMDNYGKYSYDEFVNLMKPFDQILDLLRNKITAQKIKYDQAVECYQLLSTLVFRLRSVALGCSEVLHSSFGGGSRSFENITEDVAKETLANVCKKLQIPFNDSSDLNQLKDAIRNMRQLCANALVLDRASRPFCIHLVAQLTHDQSVITAHGAVDYRMPIPPDMDEYIKTKWGGKLKFKGIRITNTRLGTLMNRYSGVLGANASVIGLPTKEIIVNWERFVGKLGIKKHIEEFENSGLPDNDVIRTLKEVGGDRVDAFLSTIIHEIRHTWQNQNNFKVSSAIMPGVNGTQEDYENQEHEKDARSAQRDYVPTDRDRECVKKALIACVQQARHSIKKRSGL